MCTHHANHECRKEDEEDDIRAGSVVHRPRELIILKQTNILHCPLHQNPEKNPELNWPHPETDKNSTFPYAPESRKKS